MKITKYLFALFIVTNLLASCTADTSVEEGIAAENQEIMANGDEKDPVDDGEG